MNFLKKGVVAIIAGLVIFTLNSCEKDIPQLDNFNDEITALGGGGAKGCPDVECVISPFSEGGFREDRFPFLRRSAARLEIVDGKIQGVRWRFEVQPNGWSVFDTGVEITILRLDAEGKVDKDWRPTTLDVEDIKFQDIFNIDEVQVFCDNENNRFARSGLFVPTPEQKAIWETAVAEGANGFRVRYRLRFQNPNTCETPAGPVFAPRVFLPTEGRAFL